ncbi:MAG: hypothetical protein VW239_10440, partial [Candidatus Nanopelagicales bacterium]
DPLPPAPAPAFDWRLAAERLGVTVTELRQRDESLAAMSAMRNYASLSDEGRDEAERFVADDLTEDTAVDYERSAVLSRAIMAAVLDGPKGPDPMALASLYLTYWEGMSKADVARALDVLPKTVSAAVERATSRIDPEGLECRTSVRRSRGTSRTCPVYCSGPGSPPTSSPRSVARNSAARASKKASVTSASTAGNSAT